MTIISSDIDVVSGSAFTTTTDDQNVTVRDGVVIDGDYGVESGISGSAYYGGASLTNEGTIFGRNDGVLLLSIDNTVLNGDTGIIKGFYAVELFGLYSSCENAGLMYGSDVGVFLSAGSDQLVNSGTITSAGSAVAAYGSNDDVLNSGQLVGASYALHSGGSDVTFRNAGSAVGNVSFDSGDNLYDGRGGTLNGTVLGGTGADTVYLGGDGETVRGGDGADAIYAGAGADTIVLTHLSASDVDHIHRFATSQDTFQIEHASFGKLTTGRPVVFATGTKARSANDHLFYNATNGALFYDPDGSGTKAAARAVADLDPGLHLTAKNFEVV